MVTAKRERDDVARYMLLKGMAFEGTKEKSVLEMAKSRELPLHYLLVLRGINVRTRKKIWP